LATLFKDGSGNQIVQCDLVFEEGSSRTQAPRKEPSSKQYTLPGINARVYAAGKLAVLSRQIVERRGRRLKEAQEFSQNRHIKSSAWEPDFDARALAGAALDRDLAAV
jgi:hypothetical protein